MRSRHADRFNHDDDSADYERDVLREGDPIRAGYGELLDWTARTAGVDGESVVLDLGCGTGNLALRLPGCRRVIGVDISSRMLDLARSKTYPHATVDWIQTDLLEVFDRELPRLDAVVSTYAVHHLEPDEKRELFARVRDALRPGGRAVFGDLMFRSAADRDEILERYRSTGLAETARDIEDEFFWDLSGAVPALTGLGFDCEIQRFSELSWGLSAKRRDP